MKRFLLLTIAVTLLLPTPANAGLFKKKKKKVQTETPAKSETKKETRPTPIEGLFNVQKFKDDWYFQIPDTLLGRLFLTTTRFIATPVNMGTYGGEMLSSHVVFFERQADRILLRALAYDATADSTDQIHRAITASTEDPIVASFKVDEEGKDSLHQHHISVKMSDFLSGDNIIMGFSESARTRFGIAQFKGEQSYVDKVSTFPMNTEIQTVKTYVARAGSNNTTAGAITGFVSFRLNTSFVLLPKDPMRPRYFDARVGYFTESHREYSDNQQQVRRRSMITRWRLEPKNAEDAARMARGELVEPKKPIVYYIDPATPKQWRKYLIQGINDWQVAFEQAGWKNAIRGEEWPENDSTMSLEDARYSVIRYLASPIANAYGPHVSDPRSGEIIETHIGWYHNVMQLIHDWYLIQAGTVDDRTHTMKFDEELMGQLIRFVSSHEVGHTLGLRHNMGASSATPVDSLRNKAWVEANGHTASIMDYARFNYVAQPEDGIGPEGIFPRINTYDKWAIEWGYKYFPDSISTEAESSEKARLAAADRERLLLNQMTIDRLSRSRRYWFGGEGMDNDPRAQTEDLSDDQMLANEYGIKNLQRIIGQLPQWVREEGDLNVNLEQMYDGLINQMRRYVGHVGRNIGGVYHDYKSVEQTGPVYVPEEKARVQRAMKWLDKHVLTEPTWLTEVSYVQRLTTDPQTATRPLAFQAVWSLCSASTISNIVHYSYSSDAYQPIDYINDVVKMLFRETATGHNLSRWRRYVQSKAVVTLIEGWKNNSSSEEHPFLTLALQLIQQRVRTASGDAATRAHYKDLDMQIRLTFEP
ncbi:MAG: zinc-dependent metalloprotease [Bacteroidaceae bacterium]|nr:zinc-dependent metalloprotease [Prevotella sp.]MBP5772335.1 zinc-dependent metalloprotease [Bacteroidaceae bacterium]